MTTSVWSATDGPWRGAGIAIVGMAGRFPMADSVDAFWRNLLDGRDCISRFTREELLQEGVAPELVDHERYVRAGAVLEGIEFFDAAFFGISPREAESMDPQQRLFLEVVQHAFDDAALDPQRYSGRIAVYAGGRLSGYWLRLMKNAEFMAGLGWHQVAAGNDKDFLPTQASFRFDLRGPSVNVQAACSTSLLAVLLGCDALVNGRCDVALAGATSIAVPQRIGYTYQPSSIASSDGKCRPFDARADGSVLGNAVAAVVLKRIDDAVADGDRIVAVLRAVAVNNDGSSKSSFAAPSVRAQTDVLERALREAALTPADIGYVEAHGTATLLGDPIEVAALARVFRRAPTRAAPLPIGSVKSNVGHLDPVAGLASLIKAAMCLQEQRIPPSLHFERPNPAIDFAAAGVRVVAEAEDWPRGAAPRRVGVSAFGIGGTNVHAVLEEAPAVTVAGDTRPELLVLSAKSPEALDAMARELGGALVGTAAPILHHAAFTLACGRRQFEYRRSLVADSPQEAASLLAQSCANSQAWLKDRPVVFLFPGQGSQRLGLGLSLYRREPVFREAVDELLALAEPHLGFDARALIDAEAHGNGGEHDLAQTAIAQPLLFAVEVACARLWMYWGVRPAQMLGHSLGELAAAHVAGVLPLRDAMRVVCRRGQLMQSMTPGAMLALSVAADEAESLAQELAPTDACIAAYNSPKQQTLSASLEAMARIEPQLRARGIAGTRLATSHAFHHRSMREAADGLRQVLAEVPLAAPALALMSCVSGAPMSDEQATQADYWARSVVEPVRFAQAAQTLLASHGEAVFIECGPGRALGSLLCAQGTGAARRLVLATLPGAANREAERRGLLGTVGQAWAAGATVNWQAFWQLRSARRIKLPGYAFQRKRFWVDAPSRAAATGSAPTAASPTAVTMAPGAENTFVRAWWPASATNAARTGVAELGVDFVVITPDLGFGSALAQRLRRDGSRVLVLRIGPADVANAGISAHMPGISTLDADLRDADAAAMLARELDTRLRPDAPLHLVNAWPLALPPGVPSVARAEYGAWLAFHAPLRLLRALKSAQRRVVAVDTVTARLFPVLPGEWPEPAAAPALGLARVLPQEVQGVRARVIDIAPPRDSNDTQRLLEQLAAELLQPGPETVLAYRGDQRLTEGFVALPLPREHRTLRRAGCFLVTGGYGAIGGVLAKALAQASPGARIALVGRRGLGEEASGLSQAARELVSALQNQGAEVLPLAADMSDPQAVHAVVAQVQAQFGRLYGVVHCAGVPGGRMLMVPEGPAAGQVMAPKVRGTVALLEALAPQAPEFVVLCSSFAAVSGGLGQGEYCAANAFLDAIAWSARAMGLRITAVDWPAWRDAGMALATSLPPELEHLRRASLETGISSAEGAELFMRILAADLPQVVIAPSPPRPAGTPSASTTAQHPPASAAQAHQQHVGVQLAPAAPHGVPALGAPPRLSSDEDGANIERLLVERIGAIWSAVLGVPVPHGEDNFFELGGQSLMALQIVSRCGEQFGISIALTDVFDQPTLGGFAAFLHQRMIERVAAMPDDEVRQRLAAAAS
jgi:acyl transferase domain-containing protein